MEGRWDEAALFAALISGSLMKFAFSYFSWWKRQKSLQYVGEISELYIYPVKSCAGVKVDQVECSKLGVTCGHVSDRFKAGNKGTHFWHAHSGVQRADGVFGPLVVRLPRTIDPHSALYDEDLTEHTILVTDWLGDLTVSRFVAHHHRDGDNKPQSILINGKGAYQLYGNKTTNETFTPYAVFNVDKGRRYRFRVASNGILNCPIQISVDDHNITMITSDGRPFEPIEVETFIIFAGERFDFVLNARQAVGNYWIRAAGLADCDSSFKGAHQLAILRYRGSAKDEPLEEKGYNASIRTGKLLNPWNRKKDDMNVPVVDLVNTDPNNAAISKSTADVKFYIGMDFNKIDNLYFHDPTYYPVSAIEYNKHLYTPQFNHISIEVPPAPPLTQLDDIPMERVCNHTTHTDCTTRFCECIYLLKVKLGDVVELVLVDEGFAFNANHPIHLHGHAFWVVALQKINESITLDKVKEMDRKGQIPRKLTDAIRKDTVTVPDGGFTVIRFVADNPGIWFMHCHIEYHVEIGMGLVFQVGEPEQFPPKPKNFPKCGDQKEEDGDTGANTTSCPRWGYSSSACGVSATDSLIVFVALVTVLVSTFTV
ncbi:laccase-2 [Lingula anatina]|uniref:Laccase-2 n=1 Tax=Lingula anatina TaxID=7574 RepID=A0A1S3KCP5_LINAN|nr:laccase-2 [Lingula anatina]|eukprot:XP_013420403.1 laccase-2 [Lingula anatina]